MNSRACFSGLGGVAGAMAAALVALLSGCERSPSARSSATPGDVRGAPIRPLAKKVEPAPKPTASPATTLPLTSSTAPPSSPDEKASGPAQLSAVLPGPVPPASTAPSGDGTIALNFDQLAGYTFEV